VDEEPEFLPIVGVIACVLPVDRGVQTREGFTGFTSGFDDTPSCELGRGDSVGKLGLWTVHSVLDGLEKEWIINGYWYNLVGKHLLSIGARFGQNPKTCVG
jgi:hypothetical protein